MHYNQEDLFRLAKRYQNTKRSYLLVNPLQAKHLAVEPCRALEMMGTLGQKLYQKYPEAKLIIGFAETATAIGMYSARQFPDDVQYLHTTRETLSGECLNFQEEHSHAVNQRLYLHDNLPETKEIILIDDEISTGKTIRNMVKQIRQELPIYRDTKFIAGSIINRVSEENLKLMEQENIYCECLCKLENIDYSAQMEQIQVDAPEELPFTEAKPYTTIIAGKRLLESRKLNTVEEYWVSSYIFARTVAEQIQSQIADKKNILVIGTEECMHPALALGEALAEKNWSVKCHATTRSPIGISQAENYPIQNGYALPSFYDSSRKTYIYNIDKTAEAVLIITDSQADTAPAMQTLSNLFPDSEKILIQIKG